MVRHKVVTFPIEGDQVSGYVFLERPGDDKAEVVDWNASTGTIHWVARFVADHVMDAGTAAKVRSYPDSGIGYLPLGSFTDEEVRDIVRVLRDLLPAAADVKHPPPDQFGAHLHDLATMAAEWGERRGL